jgi:hypothetical protein
LDPVLKGKFIGADASAASYHPATIYRFIEPEGSL